MNMKTETVWQLLSVNIMTHQSILNSDLTIRLNTDEWAVRLQYNKTDCRSKAVLLSLGDGRSGRRQLSLVQPCLFLKNNGGKPLYPQDCDCVLWNQIHTCCVSKRQATLSTVSFEIRFVSGAVLHTCDPVTASPNPTNNSRHITFTSCLRKCRLILNSPIVHLVRAGWLWTTWLNSVLFYSIQVAVAIITGGQNNLSS